jgi:topoisomerase-4 subunit A
LDLKLRHLAKLEEMELRREQNELSEQQAQNPRSAQQPRFTEKLIISELQADAKKYGDERRSPVVARGEAVEMKDSDMQPAEAITVVLSQAAGFVPPKATMSIQPA